MPRALTVLAAAIPRPALHLTMAVLLGALAGCGGGTPGGAHGFPPAQVTVATVSERDLPVSWEYVGQTTGSKDVEVRARVTGILEQKLYAEGAPVRAGQPLFTIDPKPLQAQMAAVQAEVARAQAQVAQAEREAARLKPLAERRAVGQKEADDAVSAAELARAGLKAAEARAAEVQLSLGYTRVTAPVAGLSSRAMKSEGSLVTANETLLTVISQVDPIWVPFNISENEQLAINRAVAAGQLTLPKDNGFEVSIKLADGSPFPRTGKINFADTRVNPATGTYEMRAEIANRDQALKPGQFVRVQLKGAVRRNAIAVPQTAVLDGPQGKFVYVPGKDKDGKDIATPRPVTLGPWVQADGTNLWIVESGLKAGDKVIVDGVARVMAPGSPIMLGPPPGAPGAPGTSLPKAGAKDDAKPAPAPKS
ncbi:MAG TPA: efflux RND transporter periplasmic adaptor subunit [Casimicrobiaceae bacterium]|nr:efflux RND transporter periplasmic adaptor subunit [Casimicrobiaceae bacterium]